MSGCGMCHIAAGPYAMPVTPNGIIIEPTDNTKNQIDCVLCHGKTYDGGGENNGRHVLSDNDGNPYWSMATLESAKTVGDKVTVSACKRCHINTGGKIFSPDGTMSKAFKYGTDFVDKTYEFTYDPGDGTEETGTIDSDVHAAAGITCGDCHSVPGENHKFRFGHHNVSWAHDVVPDTFNCSTCHGESPHSSSTNSGRNALDDHCSVLACQTCHIRHTGGLMKRDLRNPVEPEAGKSFYTFKDEIHYGVNPQYQWFNGKSGGWEGVIEGPCPIGPKGSKKGFQDGDGSRITPFKRYEALLWFDMLVGQPVTYILKDFLVDGDLVSAANNGMNVSGWLPEGNSYNFRMRKAMGIVFSFPMICGLKLDHGVQTGKNALGYDTASCNHCHNQNKDFWKYLGYSRNELKKLQAPRIH